GCSTSRKVACLKSLIMKFGSKGRLIMARRPKSLKSLSLAAMLGMFAGMHHPGSRPSVEKTKKNSNRVPLTEDEKAFLSSLHGRDKKIYVRKLREKYDKR